MRSWKALVCLVALPAFASGQSLGEAAKKERERRDRLRETGAASRTLTEKDLADTKGSLANNPNEAGQKSEDKETPKRAGAHIGGEFGQAGTKTSPAQDEESYWRHRVADARARLALAQSRYDDLQRQIRIGQPRMYDANGRQVIYSIYQMKEMADAAATELASAQTALERVLDEGRRAGALPGWLR